MCETATILPHFIFWLMEPITKNSYCERACRKWLYFMACSDLISNQSWTNEIHSNYISVLHQKCRFEINKIAKWEKRTKTWKRFSVSSEVTCVFSSQMWKGFSQEQAIFTLYCMQIPSALSCHLPCGSQVKLLFQISISICAVLFVTSSFTSVHSLDIFFLFHDSFFVDIHPFHFVSFH